MNQQHIEDLKHHNLKDLGCNFVKIKVNLKILKV